jgi:hypothetical protein
VKALATGTLFIPGVAGTLFKKMIEGPVGVKDGYLERLAVNFPKPRQSALRSFTWPCSSNLEIFLSQA